MMHEDADLDVEKAVSNAGMSLEYHPVGSMGYWSLGWQ